MCAKKLTPEEIIAKSKKTDEEVVAKALADREKKRIQSNKYYHENIEKLRPIRAACVKKANQAKKDALIKAKEDVTLTIVVCDKINTLV